MFLVSEVTFRCISVRDMMLLRILRYVISLNSTSRIFKRYTRATPRLKPCFPPILSPLPDPAMASALKARLSLHCSSCLLHQDPSSQVRPAAPLMLLAYVRSHRQVTHRRTRTQRSPRTRLVSLSTEPLAGQCYQVVHHGWRRDASLLRIEWLGG